MDKKVFRYALCRLRTSSHQLQIENCRWERTKPPRSDRVCPFCQNGTIEDEYHFCLVCPTYDDIQRKYIPDYFFDPPALQNVFKFLILLSTKHEHLIRQLSCYVHFAFQKRAEMIEKSG